MEKVFIQAKLNGSMYKRNSFIMAAWKLSRLQIHNRVNINMVI